MKQVNEALRLRGLAADLNIVANLRALAAEIQDLFREAAHRVNRVLPKDGSEAMTGDLQMSAATIRFSPLSPAQLTANQNDYGPTGAGAGWWRLSSDAARTITGILAGGDGDTLILTNVGAQNIILANQSASSAAANRIITGTGADVTLGADDHAELIYDSTSGRWRVRNTY